MGVGPQGSYLDRPEWSKKLITTVVDSAIKNDVYVIIDWHVFCAGIPRREQAHGMTFFASLKNGDGKMVAITTS
jgi:hypothetical protein